MKRIALSISLIACVFVSVSSALACDAPAGGGDKTKTTVESPKNDSETSRCDE